MLPCKNIVNILEDVRQMFVLMLEDVRHNNIETSMNNNKNKSSANIRTLRGRKDCKYV